MGLGISVDNMLMQRNKECFMFDSNFVLAVFYGGVYRFNTEIMIFAFVSISLNSTSFGAWHGLSCS